MAVLRFLRSLVVFSVVLGAMVWACAALWFDGPASRVLAGTLVGGFALAALAVLEWLRPFQRAVLGLTVLFACVVAWWLTLEPSNERDWLPDVARLPSATIEGDRVTIQNVRNFEYHSEEDYTERWEQRSYDLSRLTGVDLFLSYWGSPWIAHTIVSWAFDDGQHLAISIETRKEQGEAYSALRGFFRQFELYYVVADERDLIGLRTDHRGEDVYVYRLTTSPDGARAVLLDYLAEINRLAGEARWYNAATHNCTTTIRKHVQHVAANRPWDWRILVNGRIDELGYERGSVDTSLPFEELRRRSAISEKAQALRPNADFSAGIRAGLPIPTAGSG